MAADTRFLQKIDLNLLKVFKAVYDHGQTTTAAEHLGLTQPAVSQGLKRLRDLVGDPLFVPSSAGMQPTARATELAAPITAALTGIQRALERNPVFEPANAQRRFRAGMLDYGVMVFAPALADVISREAPGISVDISLVPSDSAVRLLIADQIDVVTGPFSQTPAVLQCTPLFSDDYVAIARKNHPAARQGVDVELLNRLLHVDVTFDTTPGGGIDSALQKIGVRRTMAMQVPLFAGACFVVGASDFIAIVPRKLAQMNAALCNLDILEMPDGFPRLEINALVHRRNAGDPGIRWLLAMMAKASLREPPVGSDATHHDEIKRVTKRATRRTKE